MKATRKVDHVKANGVHYTPPALASFLAEAVIRNLSSKPGRIRILDPACGDGALLSAIAAAAPVPLRRRLELMGYDTDATAVALASTTLEKAGVARVELVQTDFLSFRHGKQRRFSFDAVDAPSDFDAVIANPPYVRTQVLGAEAAQALARQFGLSGRVDLYQAFAFAMSRSLRPHGVLGLLTSNRLLTTNSGESLRRLLTTDFAVRELYDLGDTRLFSAAVLPAIVVAVKGDDPSRVACHFARAYESRDESEGHLDCPHVLDAMANVDTRGLIRTPQGVFQIEKGTLSVASHSGEKWSLSNQEYDEWLSRIRSNQWCEFQDVATVRVGIKTTADKVFVRSDWGEIDDAPEIALLQPLLTHREASRWHATTAVPPKKVLYPYDMKSDRKKPISLENYKRTRAYFLRHESELRSRGYVTDAGREWYEIWVPQIPSEWGKQKLVFPDISEEPRFFLDRSGAIVQGDCYWITLNEGVDPRWLLVMLAVANSRLGTTFYDVLFHNKLYAGRRRFMTQYVKKFPLPKLNGRTLAALSSVVGKMVNGKGDILGLEEECNDLVDRAFGLVKETVR